MKRKSGMKTQLARKNVEKNLNTAASEFMMLSRVAFKKNESQIEEEHSDWQKNMGQQDRQRVG